MKTERINITGHAPLEQPYNLPGGRTVCYEIDGRAVSATGKDLGPLPAPPSKKSTSTK
jgi:hypothetical protein